MNFEQVMDIMEVALPVLGTLLAAKMVNRNTPHWTKWTGRAGQLLGLLIEFLDLLRKPADVAKGVQSETIKKSSVLLVMLAIGLSGCAGMDWKQSVESSAVRVFKNAQLIATTALPAVAKECESIATKCQLAGDKKCEAAYKCLAIHAALSDGCTAAISASWGAMLLVSVDKEDDAAVELAKAIKAFSGVVKVVRERGGI